MTDAPAPGYGKYGGPPVVVRTSEVSSPADTIRMRMAQLGAPDEVIAEAVDAFTRGRAPFLHHLSDPELAALIGARLAGTEVSFIRADGDAIAAAREDRELWLQAREVVGVGPKGNSIPKVMAWVGLDAGRAVVAHEAEAERAWDAGVEPRNTLVKFLRTVHGQASVGAPPEAG